MKKVLVGAAMLAMLCGGCCSYSPATVQVASPVGLPAFVETTNVGLDLLVGVYDDVYGLNIGGVNWVNGRMSGLQIGIINRTDKLNGVQLGLLNFHNGDAGIGFLPFINAYFW